MPFVRSPSVLSYHDEIEFMASTMAGEAGRDALGYYHERKDEQRDVGLGPEPDWSSHAGIAQATQNIVQGFSGWLPAGAPAFVLAQLGRASIAIWT